MLSLVPVPLGHPDDFTLRGLQILREAEVIIVEEFKESSAWLRAQGISGKTFEQLNEHSTPEDLKRLGELCSRLKVALITDCGTPGFCDPGADLVRECRARGIPVAALPGASSLMLLLSLSSVRLDQFYFRGFLPAKTEEREKAYRELSRHLEPIIMMDTPYRFEKTVGELALHFPDRKILLGLDLTQPTEVILEALGKELPQKAPRRKAEFLALIYPA